MTSSFITSASNINIKLNQSLKSLDKSSSRLASGKRINSATDDAAGLAIASALESKASLRDVASRNAGYAQSATEIASSAIGQISDISIRLSELAAQAANGTLSDDQRSSLQAEYSALQDEASRIAQTTEFNGVNVLSGSSTTYQVGTDGSGNSSLQTEGSGVSSILAGLPSDISTQSAAQSALDGLQNTLTSLSQQQGQLGAISARLQYSDNSNQESKINELAAAARIQDADIGTEAANATAAQIRAKTASFLSSKLGDSEKLKYSSLLGKVSA